MENIQEGRQLVHGSMRVLRARIASKARCVRTVVAYGASPMRRCEINMGQWQ